MSQNQIEVIPVKALKDNYIWFIINQNTQHCAVVDPGDAIPAINFIQQQQLHLAAILITHHHYDHVNGIENLLAFQAAPVYGPSKENIPWLTHPLTDQTQINIEALELTFRAIESPGHTIGQIAYYNRGMVFTGDTLFSAGCGRMFEGTSEQFSHTLDKLAALPDKTKVYCGHEYTAANLRFAAAVEPLNQSIKHHQQKIAGLDVTLPSTIGLEKKINPFLRCRENTVIKAAEQHAGRSLANTAEVFAVIRKWKDGF